MASPLGTTPIEIASGLAIAAAIAAIATGPVVVGPLTGPAVVLAVGWLLLALGPGGGVAASLGRVWALSPIWTVPILLSAAGPLPWIRIGAASACLAAPVVAWQLVSAPGQEPVGLFSHHLTLAYALLPAFAGALGARWWPVAAVLAACMLATGASGAIVAVATTLVVWAAASRSRPVAVAATGLAMAATIAAFAFPSLADDVRRRAVLWTGGLDLAGQGGVPPGTWRASIAPVHRALDPSFDFPHHAHDAAVQAAGDAGPAAWVALAWGAAVLYAEAPAWGLAAAAGLAVAGLTQDWIGDLEVLRAACIWAAIAVHRGRD